jgi:hypothetical protein
MCASAQTFFSRPLLWAIASSSEADARELIEARTLIEVELAGLAADRATSEDLRLISEHLRTMERTKKNPQEFVQADVDFHLAIGHAASSGILMNALQLIRNLLQQWILSAVVVKGVPEKSLRAAQARVAGYRKPGWRCRPQGNAHPLAGHGGLCSQEKEARSGRELVRDFAQLGNSSNLHPFNHEYIAGVIEAGAMGSNKLSRGKFISSECPRLPPVARRIVS